ncbi:low temperature requirement protein A [Corynebacterium suicordis]|uniref:Low temperature requirement protein A n=1 Tax=Corynebacterium suicordis DSM 45110 TaxID=1121369 RepID=A0ABR9ZIF2_9CORY|nr:low temperature requirement protein A [Corynebacterium suicordis]MBF4553221.1 low temperature requirement protein A [Corynebacterium suicordis DSM 45110]MDR6277809.1 low temperature requirement protein LtrA [Corynebacterium suicordis]
MTRTSRFRLEPMRPRDPSEEGRTASSLELFFDLVFVVAVSVASVQLHHALTEGHVWEGIFHYAIAFFSIWWSWMNFTWFATSFDNDDWLYRVLTFVQMAGVLVLASGIGPAFEDGDFTVLVLAYVVMRLSMVAQWLRAAWGAEETRRAALLYAGGVAFVQLLWVGSLWLPGPIHTVSLVVLILCELSVPIIAERKQRTPSHPHHITERYGLFTLILLGESLLGSANAIIESLHSGEDQAPLVRLGVLALVATAALWWIYFWPPHHRAIKTFAGSLLYGYGHYFIFAAAGAFSAGIELEIDVLTGHTDVTQPGASFAYTIPLAIFIIGVWLLTIRRNADRIVNIAVPLAGFLVLIDPLIPVPFALTVVILVAVVAVLVWRRPLGDQQPQQSPVVSL